MLNLLKHFQTLREQGELDADQCILRVVDEEEDKASVHPSPEIDQIILIDRGVDMVTPFCHQLTYEGLIDEFLHIRHGTITLATDVKSLKGQG